MNIYHSGFISYCKPDDLQEWFTLTEDNQEITFTDNGVNRNLNSLIIEAELVALYVQIGNFVLHVPANEIRSINYLKVNKITVLNTTGTKLRWSGCFY